MSGVPQWDAEPCWKCTWLQAAGYEKHQLQPPERHTQHCPHARSAHPACPFPAPLGHAYGSEVPGQDAAGGG